MFRDYFKLVTLYKIGEVYFCLLGTNGCLAKAENERFTAADSRCHQNLKNREFMKLRRLLLRKCHFQIDLCVRLSVLRLFQVGQLYKISEVYFCLLGTKGFHVKAKNERFTTASSRCRQNLKYGNFTSSSGRLRQ